MSRRAFLRTAAGATAGAVASRTARGAQAAPAAAARPQAATRPTRRALEAELAPEIAPDAAPVGRCGADFMVDVLKSLDLEYVASNPGSSFRALHESIVSYGGNSQPEFLTCCHEESSVAIAHGYAKAAGRPMAVLAHGTVGLQHASMAVYNAWCDHAPVYIVLGNNVDVEERRPGVEWAHSVQDAASLARDFIKWDDVPASLTHFAESAVRAYKIATTPPHGPVILVADLGLQERPLEDGVERRVPRLTPTTPPQGDSGAVAEVAEMLVGAESPLLVADRAARTPAGVTALVELAELLQAGVVDQGGRMNFPSRHPLNQSARAREAVAEADVIVGLEVNDFWGTLHSMRDQADRTIRRVARPEAKTVSITASDLYLKSNYQDFQRYAELDLALAADAEATLPALIEEVKRRLTPEARRRGEARAARLAQAHREAHARLREEASWGWDASPISTARLTAEVGALVRDEDWSLVSQVQTVSYWPLYLWRFDQHHQYLGGSGGAGIGYQAPAAVGAALANRAHGRLSVCLQTDGDLMYAPGVLWTAAHHRVPLLSVMHNNRAYHQEVMHLQRMANRHGRGVDRAGVGTTLVDPEIDFAQLARSMGVHAEGPIRDPAQLAPALKRALAVVKSGAPALVDVVSQPR